jgi:hypothetical protein
MVPNGNWPHAKLQEILGLAALVILRVIAFIASYCHIAETETERHQTCQ